MCDWVQITVIGEARGMGSKIAVTSRRTGRAIVIDVGQAKLRKWQASVRQEMMAKRRAAALAGPMQMALRHWVRRPKSHYGTGRNAKQLKDSAPEFPESGPDLDKILRAIQDCGTRIWWEDDDQVGSFALLDRVYIDDDHPECAWIAFAPRESEWVLSKPPSGPGLNGVFVRKEASE